MSDTQILVDTIGKSGNKPEVAIVDLMASLRYDPLSFCKIAYDWGKGELSGSDGLRDWQQDICGVIGDHLKNSETRYTPLQIAVSSGHGVGKSCLVSMLIDWAMSTCVDTKIVVTANTENQLRTKTWPEVIKWFRNSINSHWFGTTATAVMSVDEGRVSTWRADAIPWSENNTEAFAGLHNKGKRLVLIFDEASSIVDKVWEVAEGAMTDADTEIIWLAFGNPTMNTGRFRECFGKFKHRWVTRKIDSRTVDGTNKDQIQKWVNDYGEDSDFVRVRVRGEFPRSGNLQFISSAIVEEARKRPPEAKLMDARVMGVDVARFGDDESVICFRQGRDAQSNKWIKLRNVDTMTLAAHIVDAARWFHPDAIFVDGGGVGGGVIDRLRMLRQPVIEVQFGSAADRAQDTDEGAVYYANKRAEMWGYMRDWLRGGSIPDDPDLVEELTGIQFGYIFREGRDTIILEKKADMKKRGLSSPDCFIVGTLIATPNGDVAIERLSEGDEVVTPFGISKIIKKWVSETEELTTAHFSNGAYLTGKGAHKIFSWTGGQVRLDALSFMNGIASIEGLWKWRLLRLLRIEGRSSEFKVLVDTISHTTTEMGWSDFCTGVCGLTIMEIYRKGITYITKMMIGLTTIYPIWSQSLAQNMGGNTWRSVWPILCTESSLRVTGKKLFSKPPNGTLLLKGLNGTGRTPLNTGKLPRQKRDSAASVMQISRHTWLMPGFVRHGAPRKRHVQINVISQIKEVAHSVEKNLWRIGIWLRSIVLTSAVVAVEVKKTKVRPTKVYNLTLERHNAYYANGILVFNCADALALTFAAPVMPSDHRGDFENAVKGGHRGQNYNPYSIDRVRNM